MPNPWDAGSARFLSTLGFKALASTSAGAAWSRGLPDGKLGLRETLQHLRDLVAATSLPVNADFESGHGATPEEVARSVSLAVRTGVAGLSIEDSTGDEAHPVRSLADSVERVRAARRAIDTSNARVLLTARAENFFLGIRDIGDTLERLKAYAEAGADCLFAPGIDHSHIPAVVAAVHPKPVNFLVSSASGISLKELARLGVRRVSLGGSLARSAWSGLMRSARLIAADGSFDGLRDAVRGSELNSIFRD